MEREVAQPGESIGGFEIRSVLRHGADAITYAVIQPELDRAAELDLLARSAPNELRERFLAESAALVALDHPAMVPVLDSGEDEHGVYRVTLCGSGGQLGEAIARSRLGSAEVLAIAGDIAGALDALHGRGLTHRSLSPAAIQLGSQGSGLLDRPGLPPASSGGTTAIATLPGLESYVAPEIRRGTEPTPASDLFALAAILFEALTGHPAFTSAEEAAAYGPGVPAPSAGAIRREIPAAASDALARGLDADPAMRPGSAAELVGALEQAMAGTELPPPGAGAVLWRRRRGLVAIPAATIAIGLAVLAISSGDESTVPQPLEGAMPIGSDLELPAGEIRTLDCDGEPPSKRSRPCSIIQTELDGALLAATENGSIRSWTVRGFEGEAQFGIFRPRDDGFFQVFISQLEPIPDRGIHTFDANIEVEKGDVVALQVPAGSGVGVAAGGPDAASGRFFPPKYGGEPIPPTQPAGTGFDHEMLARFDFMPGLPIDEPEQLDGAEARRAPDGTVLGQTRMSVGPELRIKGELVQVGDRLWLDLVHLGARTSRVEMQDAEPDGELVRIEAIPYGDGLNGQIDVEWQNPGELGTVVHIFQTVELTFDFIS